MKKLWILFILALLGLAGCQAANTPSGPANLVLMTHDSFNISEGVLAQFTAETGHQVEIFKAGDAGEMVNKAILTGDAPLADVLFGVDNTFLSRALDNDLFLPYESPRLADIPGELQLDAQHRALPVDFGDVCLNYDRAWFAARGLPPPAGLEELAGPAYRGLTVVENPATSSPGLAFLLATIAHFGEDGYLAYWQRLVENDVLVTNGWEEAYYGQFSAASDGDRPLVVSYASSPPAEVYFAASPPAEPPTGAVTAPGTCFRQIEFAGILKGTQNEAAARQLVDFLLSRPFQEDVPLQMFVYPANREAALPEVFVRYGPLAEEPASLDPALIAANREQWIAAWTEVVLQR